MAEPVTAMMCLVAAGVEMCMEYAPAYKAAKVAMKEAYHEDQLKAGKITVTNASKHAASVPIACNVRDCSISVRSRDELTVTGSRMSSCCLFYVLLAGLSVCIPEQQPSGPRGGPAEGSFVHRPCHASPR